MTTADPIDFQKFQAALFDLDGVLTPTATVHATCWKRMFDEFLTEWAESKDTPFNPFDIAADYGPYVDGKPRYEGVESFLASRGITLPMGDPSDDPKARTVCGLGNRKNVLIHDVLKSDGVEAYEGSVAFVDFLRHQGIRCAVVSSSKNCQAVLAAADIENLFELRIDGVSAAERGLPGKPAPDTFLEASKELGVPAARAIVIEDAIVGVQAGRAGQFGLVIGVSRKKDEEALQQNGADIVVHDLAELIP